jgi:hypothetical protein
LLAPETLTISDIQARTRKLRVATASSPLTGATSPGPRWPLPSWPTCPRALSTSARPAPNQQTASTLPPYPLWPKSVSTSRRAGEDPHQRSGEGFRRRDRHELRRHLPVLARQALRRLGTQKPAGKGVDAIRPIRDEIRAPSRNLISELGPNQRLIAAESEPRSSSAALQGPDRAAALSGEPEPRPPPPTMAGNHERVKTTDQLRTTPAELSAHQRSTLDTSDKWFTLDNRGGPIWGVTAPAG